MESTETNWWLATACEDGYADKLLDGPHETVDGANRAMYLHLRLGLCKPDTKYCVVKVDQFEPNPTGQGVDEEAINVVNSMARVMK
jgi:hypothetical protein